MCIAISKPEGFTIDEETINNCWEANSDGGGFMYAKDETLFIVKGLMTLKEFKDAYEIVGELPAVLHFRIKTHGKQDRDNTHPFRISDKLAVVHNGIISNIYCGDKDRSDTWHFTEHILKPMSEADGKFYHRPVNQELIRGYINSSKLVFLNNRGEATIINADKGEWKDGLWFSNSSYKKREVVVYQGRSDHNYAGWYNRDDVRGNTSVHRYMSPKSYLNAGDYITVSAQKSIMSPEIGTPGQVKKIFSNGYISVIFHDIKEGGVVEEKSIIMHENDVEQFSHVERNMRYSIEGLE